MSEESNERYEIVIKQETVLLVDSEDGTWVPFSGPDRLLAATAELNRLNAAEEGGEWHHQDSGTWKPFTPHTPAAFLAETLPAVARRQRLESQLVQVIEIKEHARSEAARWHEISSAAWELQSRIEAALVRPLSSTETAQNAKGVVEDTPLIRNGYGYPTGVQPYQVAARANLFKPQPY